MKGIFLGWSAICSRVSGMDELVDNILRAGGNPYFSGQFPIRNFPTDTPTEAAKMIHKVIRYGENNQVKK